MPLLPLTSSGLSALSSGTHHRDSAEKLIGAEADAIGVLTALVSVLEVGSDEEPSRWSSKDRVKALVALSNLAQVESLRNEILRAFRGTSASFEALLAQKEKARKAFGNNKSGAEHLLVIVLLYRVVDYRLGADDLLDLLSGDVEFALSLIEALLKGTSYEVPLHIGLLRTLGEFVHPATYFTGALETDEGKSAAVGTKSKDLSERSCSEFTEKVDRIVQQLMSSSSLLPSVVAAVRHRLDKFGKKNTIARAASHSSPSPKMLSTLVRYALGFLYNTHLFMNGFGVSAAAFRQHLVVATKVSEDIVLPFLENVFCKLVSSDGDDTAAADNERSDDDNALFMAAQGCFQMLTVLYFRFQGSAKERMLRANTVTATVIRSVGRERFLCWPKLMGMMVLFNANVDSLGDLAMKMESSQEEWPEDCRSDVIYSSFKDMIEPYKSESVSAARARVRLINMMEDPEPLPVARDSETLRKLCSLLETLIDAEGGESEDAKEDDGIIIEEAELPMACADPDPEEEKATEERQPPNAKQRKTPPGFGSSQGRFRLLGHLPTFDAHRKDRVEEAREIDSHNRQKKHDQRRRQEKRRRRKDRTKSTGVQAERHRPRNKPGGANCPEEFRCALDGCIMKAPTRAKPSGLVFERETIEKWLAKSGNVCPVTGEPLHKEDLEADLKLGRRIGKFFIDKALGAPPATDEVAPAYGANNAVEGKIDRGAERYMPALGGGFDDEDDLYKF